MSVLETCRSCGYDHENLQHIHYQRNHVSNKTLPYCAKCSRRLYQVPYYPGKTSL